MYRPPRAHELWPVRHWAKVTAGSGAYKRSQERSAIIGLINESQQARNAAQHEKTARAHPPLTFAVAYTASTRPLLSFVPACGLSSST